MRNSRLGDNSRLWLSFSISHFKMHPDEVSRLLAQKPTRILVKGEKYANGKRTQKFNSWSLKIESPKYDLDKQLEVLFKKLKRFSSAKRKLGKFHAGVTAVLEVVGEDSRPSIHVPALQLKQMAKMELIFGVDYYFFSKSSVGQ